MRDEMPTDAVSVLRMGSDDGPNQTKRIKTALKRIEGVHQVEFDYIQNHVQVKYDPSKVDEAKLKKAIRA